MEGRISGLPTVTLDHIANLLVRNCTEWTQLGGIYELYQPFTTQALIERKLARHNYTAQELCVEILKELATNRISLQTFVDALKKLGLLGLANKMTPIINGQVAPQWMYLLANFEQRNKTNSNSHVILFPNLDDGEIARIASKMKMDLTLEDVDDVLDADKNVGLTIHWLETTTKDVKTTIALVNTCGKVDKAWPMFIRQFGKPPNVSIVQFHEEDKNCIVIPQTVVTPTSTIHLNRVDELLIDYWRNNDGKNCCSTHESHAEIFLEKNVNANANLQMLLQHVNDVDDKLVFKVCAKDKEFMMDQVACFLQCWTASFPDIKSSQTVIAQMSFDEHYPNQQITIPTNEDGHVILSRFSADESTVVIFATTVENYWRLWIDYPDIKSAFKNQGWTLTSMTPVSKHFVDALQQLSDVPEDLIDALSFFLDDVQQIAINIANYLDVQRLNMKSGTTFFHQIGSNSQKELAAKDIEAALNKAWPKEDYNTKPEKFGALLNFFNIVPSDKTHNGLNEAWTDARKRMQAMNDLERLTLTEDPISVWYSNWLWTLIKKSTKLKTIGVPRRMLIPNILVINSLKQIPDYITLEFECLDINIKTIIDSLVNKTIVLKKVVAGPSQFPDPKRNRITVECVQLIDEDTSTFDEVLQIYPNSRLTVILPENLMTHTSVMIDMCRRINRARSPANWNFPNLEVGLEVNNADKFAEAYPLIPRPITVRSIVNYFDTAKAGDIDFRVDYEEISHNCIPLSVESVEAAVELKKHLIVKDIDTQMQLNIENFIVVQNKLMIKCSPGKFYSIKRQISGFAPSTEIIVPTLHLKLVGKVYPDMSQPDKRQIFLEHAKKLDASNQTPLCYFCKVPLQADFELINIVPWAKSRWNINVLPVHSHCNTARNKHLFTVVLQPNPFSFPLMIRTLAIEDLLPAVIHYIEAAEVLLDSKYDNLTVTTVLKMDELEYNMEDEDWRKLSEYFLNLLLTTYEHDVIGKSLVSIDLVPSKTNFNGTYLGQDIYVKTIPAKNALRDLFWLKVLKFPNIVQFLGYYYEDKDTAHLLFEKMKCDLSTIKLGDLKKEVRLRIARQICAAMAFLHSKDIVYISLKPSRILLDDQHNAKLIYSSRRTDQMEVAYTSPELVEKGVGSASKASDVYAFGILLLELASTKGAWEGRSNKQIAETIKNGWLPESLRKFDMQSELYQLIAQCLDKEPTRRPPFSKIQAALRNEKLTESFA